MSHSATFPSLAGRQGPGTGRHHNSRRIVQEQHHSWMPQAKMKFRECAAVELMMKVRYFIGRLGFFITNATQRVLNRAFCALMQHIVSGLKNYAIFGRMQWTQIDLPELLLCTHHHQKQKTVNMWDISSWSKDKEQNIQSSSPLSSTTQSADASGIWQLYSRTMWVKMSS